MSDFATLKSDGTPSGTARTPAEGRVLGEELWWEPVGTAGVAVTEHTALQLPAMLATAVVLATDVAVLPLDVYRRTEDGGREERRDHPNSRLLRRSPDGETTPIRWRQAWMGHSLIHGNGYSEIQRKGNGKPSALHLLDPETTHPDRRDGRLVYRLDGGRTLAAANVLHLAGFGFDGLSGYNFVRLIRQAIGMGLAAEGYGADYFANGAEPGGVIEVPTILKDPAIKNLRESWDDKHRGPGRRHRPAVLEQGAKWHETSADPEKSQLLETRKFQVNDVTRPWRVPPHKIGDYSQAHLANIEASNLDYLMTALIGWLEAIEQECNLKLFTESEYQQGYYVEHNTAALLRGDTLGRYQAYEMALRNGWMNRDQVRKRENENAIGAKLGGDIYTIQAQMTPLNQAGSAFSDPGNAPAATPPAGRARRFNPNHGSDGKFAPGSGGGDGGGGGGGGGDGTISVAGEKWTPDQLDEMGKHVAEVGRSGGQDWSFTHGPPRSDAERKLSDKAEAKERFLVVRSGKPKTAEVQEGGVLKHKVGGEPVAETFKDPSGAGWVSRQFSRHAPGGHDDFKHKTEDKALRDSRGQVKHVQKLQSFTERHTPRDLRQHFDDERSSTLGNNAATFSTTYRLVLPG